MILSVTVAGCCKLTAAKTATSILNPSYSFKSAARTSRNASVMAIAAEVSGFRIQETFSNLKKNGKVAFIPYITAGDPDLKTTEEALKILDACGSNIIELGVPYCDQLADGPVIQAAAARALAQGTTLNSVLSMLEKVIPQISSPVILFTYYNPILKRGVNAFMSKIRSAGVSGLLVPDIPLEETEALRDEASRNGIELVLLTTPTTPTSRIKRIADASQGFVYLVSSVGVTGTRESVSENVRKLLGDVKESTSKPVAVGFGISTADQARQVAEWGADGVIVGSAVVKMLGESASPDDGLRNLQPFVKSLVAALP